MRVATICLVAGLAMVAVVATLVPSTSGVFAWPEIGWAVAPSLWVLNASIGVLAALSVLVASRDTDGARYLGVLLALLALAAGFGTADEALLPDVLRGLGLGWALAFVIGGVWVRFALLFPRPLTHQDVAISLTRQRVLEVGWDAPKAARAYRASREAFAQRFPRFTALQRRIRAPFLWLEEK